MQVDSYILQEDIVKDMKNKIKETKKQKLEIGFALCVDKDDHRIKKGTECIGTRCRVKIGQCEKDQIYIGNFHTHPRSYSTMSITDMVTGCSAKMECVGSIPFNNIRCFTRKTEESQCRKEIAPFISEEDEILEEREKIRSILKSPKTLIRTNVNLLKDISHYETRLAKYNSNRFELLNKHFNRIDIR